MVYELTMPSSHKTTSTTISVSSIVANLRGRRVQVGCRKLPEHCTDLLHRYDLHMSFSPNHRDAEIVWMSLQLQIDLRVADGEIAEAHPVDRLWQLAA